MIRANAERKEQWPGQRNVLAAVQGSTRTSIWIIPRTHGVAQIQASTI
jgi:hypothetical protein